MSNQLEWLWSPNTSLELFAFLESLRSGDLDEAAFQRLVDTIVAGPPERNDEEGQALREGRVLTRLLKVDRSGCELPGEAKELMTRLKGQVEGWEHLASKTSELGVHVDVGSVYEAVREDGPTIEEMSVEQLAVHLVEKASASRPRRWEDSELERHLAGIASSNPRRLLSVIRRLSSPVLPKSVANALAMSLESEQLEHESWGECLRLIGQFDPRTSDYAELIARFVERFREGARDERLAVFLDAWDMALQVALHVRMREVDDDRDARPGPRDEVQEAINHPAGLLCTSLLEVLTLEEPTWQCGMAREFRCRLERILESVEVGGRPGRVVVGSRLYLLHYIDDEWTAQHLVPLMSWTNPEAGGIWQGYMWSPTITDTLYRRIRRPFLKCFEHWGVFGRWNEPLVGLFVSLAVDATGLISESESKRCLTAMEEDGRVRAISILARRLQAAGDKKGSLWRERIGVWFGRSWPRSPELQTSETSARLAWMVTETGEEFARAVSTVAPFIGRVDNGMLAMGRIDKYGIASTFARATAELLAAMLPDVVEPGSYHGLTPVLREVVSREPSIREEPQLAHVYRLAVRAGVVSE